LNFKKISHEYLLKKYKKYKWLSNSKIFLLNVIDSNSDQNSSENDNNSSDNDKDSSDEKNSSDNDDESDDDEKKYYITNQLINKKKKLKKFEFTTNNWQTYSGTKLKNGKIYKISIKIVNIPWNTGIKLYL
jgi:hypothetical protein